MLHPKLIVYLVLDILCYNACTAGCSCTKTIKKVSEYKIRKYTFVKVGLWLFASYIVIHLLSF